MGIPCHSLRYRSDNKLYKIQTPQSPVVRPAKYDTYDLDSYPLGTNAVVAVISYTVGLRFCLPVFFHCGPQVEHLSDCFISSVGRTLFRQCCVLGSIPMVGMWGQLWVPNWTGRFFRCLRYITGLPSPVQTTHFHRKRSMQTVGQWMKFVLRESLCQYIIYARTPEHIQERKKHLSLSGK